MRYLDLKEKFKDILKAQSPVPRTCYYYATSVTVCLSCFISSSPSVTDLHIVLVGHQGYC